MVRPSKESEPGGQATISLRVPAELKARLEQRAAENHRNLSQEVERALVRSFDGDALLADALGLPGMGERFDYLLAKLDALQAVLDRAKSDFKGERKPWQELVTSANAARRRGK
jgi:hypothetical protein